MLNVMQIASAWAGKKRTLEMRGLEDCWVLSDKMMAHMDHSS